MTLAIDQQFKTLFVVLIFHRESPDPFFSHSDRLRPCLAPELFEGLGLGSRLAFMKLPSKYNWIPVLGALLYGTTTPLGIAIGLGIRSTYNPGSTTASIVSGIFDSISSGILLYTGLVEVSLLVVDYTIRTLTDCLPLYYSVAGSRIFIQPRYA